jgi:hypothetical protein
MPAPPATPTIEEVVAAIPAWRGRAIRIEAIAGGLTNRNYRVDVDGAPHFVRIPGRASELLAIDRRNELHNTRAAASAGVGPQVLRHLPRWDVMVLEWLPGRTMSNGAFAQPTSPARIAAALHRLHAGPRFRLDFDMFRLTEFYLGVVADQGVRIPPGFRAALPAVARIERALASRRAAVDRRLRIQRQQRPDLRAGQHLPGARLRRRSGGRTVRRLLWLGQPGAARPDAPPDDHVGRGLDALGSDPGPDLDDPL